MKEMIILKEVELRKRLGTSGLVSEEAKRRYFAKKYKHLRNFCSVNFEKERERLKKDRE